MVRVCIGTILFFALGPGSLQTVAQTPLAIEVLAEKTVSTLPAAPLFWRIETFPTLALARAAEGQWDLVAESAGTVWLFRLGPADAPSSGGTKVADVGPLPDVVASQYLTDLHALVMFVVDATKPFSSPANLP